MSPPSYRSGRTHCAGCIANNSIALSGIYYVFWVKLLPKWGNYTIRQTIVALEDGSVTNKLVKVPNDELSEWDAEHDATGKFAQSISSEYEHHQRV